LVLLVNAAGKRYLRVEISADTVHINQLAGFAAAAIIAQGFPKTRGNLLYP
jgi:hypothetical protein